MAPPAPLKTTTTTRTTIEPITPGESTIDAWLLEQSVNPDIQSIRVQKRSALSGAWSMLPRPHCDLMPPFDVDLHKIFETFGDGDYRFMPLNSNTRKPVSSRSESVMGYGVGTFGKTSTIGDGDETESGMGSMIKQMREMVEMERMRAMMGMFRERSDGGGAIIQAPERDPDAELDRFVKLAALLRPSNEPNPMMMAMLQGVFAMLPVFLKPMIEKATASEPDKMLDMLGKVLELKDKLGDGGEMTWEKALMTALAGAGPAIASIAGKVAPAAPARVALPPTPASILNPPIEFQKETKPVETVEVTETDKAERLFIVSLWPLLKSAAQKGSDNFDAYADMLDEHFGGFLDQWGAVPWENAINGVAIILNKVGEPELVNDPVVMGWFAQFHAHIARGMTETPIPPVE